MSCCSAPRQLKSETMLTATKTNHGILAHRLSRGTSAAASQGQTTVAPPLPDTLLDLLLVKLSDLGKKRHALSPLSTNRHKAGQGQLLPRLLGCDSPCVFLPFLGSF